MSDRRLRRKLEKESRLLTQTPGDAGPERFSLGRSGLMTASLLAVAVVVFGLVWHAHQRAAFHQFTASAVPEVAATPMPGGQEAALLNRLALHSAVPEFAHAIVLPGIGMQVLQLSVRAPEHGVASLLEGPTVAAVAAGAVPDAAPFHLAFSAAGQSADRFTDQIGRQGAVEVANRTQADGGEVTGTFRLLDAAGKPAGVEAKIDCSLTGRSFDVDVRLRSNALTSHEFSLAWSPNFRAPADDLGRFTLSIPSSTQWIRGAAQSVQGTALDFSSGSGRPVPDADFDVSYVALRRSEVGEGPSVLLTDRDRGVVLRIVLLSPSIRTVRARGDASGHVLMLSFGTDDGAERTLLAAGESADWRVRMDVLPLSTGKADAASERN